MLENLIFSLNSVMPFFLLILLGACFVKIGIAPKSFFQTANSFIFKVALPTQLFYNVAATTGESMLTGSFMLYSAAVAVASFFVIWGVTELIYKDKTIIGTLVQGAYRGNYILLGIPLAGMVLGTGAMQAASVASVVVIPLHNIFSIIVLLARGNAKPQSIRGTLKGIALNPLIIGILLAIPVMVLQIRLPEAILRTIMYVGATGTPLGLLSVGGVLTLAGATARLGPAIYASMIKVLLLPAVIMPVSYLLGFRGEELLILLMMTATPSAVSSYVMAVEMNGDGPLAANIMILTTLFSAFILAAGIYIMRSLGLI